MARPIAGIDRVAGEGGVGEVTIPSHGRAVQDGPASLESDWLPENFEPEIVTVPCRRGPQSALWSAMSMAPARPRSVLSVNVESVMVAGRCLSGWPRRRREFPRRSIRDVDVTAGAVGDHCRRHRPHGRDRSREVRPGDDVVLPYSVGEGRSVAAFPGKLELVIVVVAGGVDGPLKVGGVVVSDVGSVTGVVRECRSGDGDSAAEVVDGPESYPGCRRRR